MAPSIALRIPYEPKPEKDARSLQNDVEQLITQKGPFNVVTEQDLLDDQALSGDNVVDEDESENGDGANALAKGTQQQTLERLYQARQQMIHQLGGVQDHIITIVDTIAFSIASRSRIGEASVSSATKQAGPIGSIEIKSVAPRPPLRPETTGQYDDISTATRAQAFQTAAEKLAAASNRLEAESQKQAQYWQQMAALRKNGWPLSRLPSNDRLLVMHYACGESGQQYQNKGVAILRQEDSGNLILPGQVDTSQQKVLSVSIQRKGVKTGRFVCIPKSESTQMQIENDLGRAKESLFQEELFNEIAREARLVANLGVKIRSSHLEIELSPDAVAHISYIIDTHEMIQTNATDQHLAQYIAMGLRTMLIAEYEHKHSLRSTHPPQPLTQTPRPPVEYAILRPLLAQLKHDSKISMVLRRLEPYQATLKRAGFTITWEQQERQDSRSGTSEALQDLRKTVSTSIRLQLPTGTVLTIVVDTYLGPPTFGTSFVAEDYTNVCGTLACAQTSSTEDINIFLEDVLAQEIANMALGLTDQSSQWTCTSQFPLEFRKKKVESGLNSLKMKCSNGSLVVLSRKLDEPLKSAIYTCNSAQISESGGKQEDVELQLPELLQKWTS